MGLGQDNTENKVRQFIDLRSIEVTRPRRTRTRPQLMGPRTRSRP